MPLFSANEPEAEPPSPELKGAQAPSPEVKGRPRTEREQVVWPRSHRNPEGQRAPHQSGCSELPSRVHPLMPVSE